MDEESAIRWDIVEEHLDEAGFLYGQWEAALRSPDYTLAQIAQGLEERLLAHLDGLVLGGPRVAKRLIVPAIAADEPGVVFAAAFALTDGGRPDDFAALLAPLEKGEAGQRAAIRRALGVVPRTDLPQRLAAVAIKGGPLQVELLEVLGVLRFDPGLRLEPLANAKEPRKEALALRLARVFPERLDPSAVERGFTSPVPEVRAAALETGMIAGNARAAAACETTVREKGPGFATAALLLGLSGEDKHVSLLISALGDPDSAGDAAYALGFTGRVRAADALLEQMADEKLFQVAMEGLSAITGLAVQKTSASPSRRSAPGVEGAETPGPRGDPQIPERAAITRSWQELRPKLDLSRAWLRGQPWSAEALLRELERGPARRRGALALDIAARSRGHLRLTWDALSARQRSELDQCRGGLSNSSFRSSRELGTASPRPPAAKASRGT